MGEPKNGRVLMATDMAYLFTFTAGMAAFWASGQVRSLLPPITDQTLAIVTSMVVTAGIYGLGMLLVAFIMTRRFGRSILVAVILAIVLGLAAAQGIVRLSAGRVHATSDIALLTFVLYLVYGGIYVGSLAFARKFAK